jgi:hypothetical protein
MTAYTATCYHNNPPSKALEIVPRKLAYYTTKNKVEVSKRDKMVHLFLCQHCRFLLSETSP